MKVLEGQSIIDISVQNLGSADAAYQLAALNNISVTDNVTGHDLLLPEVANKTIASYYANKALQPATASSEDASEMPRTFFPEFPLEFE